MFEVYLDGRILYYPGDDEYGITEAVLELSVEDAGSFDFCISQENPEYDNLKPRVSMVRVLKNGTELFYGEVGEIKTDTYKVKHVYCVGELAFLFDSIQPPAEYHDLSPRQMLETWLNIHNSQVEEKKRFDIGIVTIHDSNDSLYRYTNHENTLEAVRDKLTGRLGGCLKVRKADGKRYVDWLTLEDYGKIPDQSIEFGENLLDYAKNVTTDGLYTAVIPLGARLDESPIEALEAYTDIKSVNGGVDYVYSQEAVNAFGWIKAVVKWDDVHVPSILKTKAEEWLKDNQFETMSLEVTGVDLSELGADCEAFEIGDRIHVFAQPYGMDRKFPLTQQTIFLQEPDSNKYTLGSTEKKSIVSSQNSEQRRVETELQNIQQTSGRLQSAINNTTQMMVGGKGGYRVSEYDQEGRWIRDLYMDAPNKETAQHVMQINMNGIGFSRDGYAGPYKNAWTIDGVLLGEFIKAHSIQAEALSIEYTDSVEASIKAMDGKIEMKVSEGEVSSKLSMEKDKIELNGNRVVINSANFGLTQDGTVNARNANISGTMATDNGTRRTTVSGGGAEFFYRGAKTGELNPCRYSENDSYTGVDLSTNGKALSLSVGNQMKYALNNGLNPNGLGYTHIFYDAVYTNTWMLAQNVYKVDPFTMEKSEYTHPWNSDKRLKENIEPAEVMATEKIEKLRFVQFDWKNKEEHEKLGLVADELQEIIPEAVIETEQDECCKYDSLKSIDMQKMLVYALKSIQELTDRVKKLENRKKEEA